MTSVRSAERTTTRGSFGTFLFSLRGPLSRPGQPAVRGITQPGRDRWRWIGIDTTALLALCALSTAAFRLTYGPGWVWVSGIGGAAVGLVVGLVAAVRRLPTWLTAVIWALTYLVVGTALTMPQQGLHTVLPTSRTLRQLVLGVVGAWKESLTISAPIGETGALLVVPLITMMLAGTLGISVALRSTRPGWAWLAPATAACVGIAFGVQTVLWPTVVAVGFAVITLVWTAYRRDYLKQTLLGQRRSHAWQPVVSAAGVLVLASGCAALATPVVAPSTYRHVLRDAVVPPVQVQQWPSPLQSFRANVKDHKSDVLMTVTGLPEGAMIRLATMDAYDGITMNVTNTTTGGADGGAFTRIGTRVPDDTPGERAQITVTIGDYAGIWVPTVGQLHSIDFAGDRALDLSDQLFYNRSSGTAVTTSGVRPGDRYTVEVVVPPQPSHADIATADAADVDLPPVEPIPDELTDAGQRWATGAAGQGDVAIKLEAELRRGFFSHGLENEYPSLSGHSYYRLQKLFTDQQMVGDGEQYAVAMALMARQLGLPARVVYGYRPQSAGTVEITGDDVSAWVEVNLRGHGWVIFSPTPDKSRQPQSDTEQQESKPRPQVDNPPPPPNRPENPPPDNTPPPQAPDQDDQNLLDQIPWALIGKIALAVGVPLLLLGGPLVAVVVAKRRRRARRLADPEPTSRVAGAWAHLVERARDLGVPVSPRTTRSETAASLTGRFPSTGGLATTPAALARRADASVFGIGEPSQPQIEEYWRDVDAATASMRTSSRWWRRVRAPFALTSLRTWR